MTQLVSITQAAKLTGLSTYILRKGAKEGRFPSLRAGGTTNGKILFDLELLAQTLATEAIASIKQSK
jgi:hypothetical protein